MESMIRNIELAPEGQLKLDWVQAHMPLLNSIREEMEKDLPFRGKKIVVCLHLEAKTGYLATVLKAGGADVCVVASNPLSTQDDVVAALAKNGICACAWYNASEAEYRMHLDKALDFHPDLIIDDGGDLVTTLHTCRPSQVAEIIGGCEETTTGILRLKAMAQQDQLLFPMIAVNDAYCKYLFDNRYGTGQSVWSGINRTTNLVVAGKVVVVAGYGWCGKGVAMRAKGLGARVIVTEIDPIKAIEAVMDGFQVMTMEEAAPLGDFFITVTGNKNVIRREHLAVIKDKAILSNAGHFDVEISKPDLDQASVSKRVVRNNIEEYLFHDGRRIYLLAEGRLVNLAAGDGHPAEIMDMTFALQALALKYVMENSARLGRGVYEVPQEIDRKIALMKLETWNIQIDRLTDEQEQYLADWQG